MQQSLPGAWNASVGVALCFNNRLQVNLLIQKSSIFGGGGMRHVYITWELKTKWQILVFQESLWSSFALSERVVWCATSARKLKNPMLFDENKNKLSNLRSVRSATIRQRINRTGQNVLLFHAGKYHSPQSKILNSCPRWIRPTLENSGMWPHRSLDLNPCDYLSELLKRTFHINNPRCLKDNIRRASATISKQELGRASINIFVRCVGSLEAGYQNFVTLLRNKVRWTAEVKRIVKPRCRLAWFVT